MEGTTHAHIQHGAGEKLQTLYSGVAVGGFGALLLCAYIAVYRNAWLPCGQRQRGSSPTCKSEAATLRFMTLR